MKLEFRTEWAEKPNEETEKIENKLSLVKKMIEIGAFTCADETENIFIASIEIKECSFTVKFFYENDRDFVILPYEFFENNFYTVLANDYVRSKINEIYFKNRVFKGGD